MISFSSKNNSKSVHCLTSLEKSDILTLINNLTELEIYDYSIDKVILEELQKFYKGSEAPENAIKSIQERVKIYLNE